tara:strand:- start:19890 stop:20348 length:459 start_codon:yes stop_codon:yes gene_type:complete
MNKQISDDIFEAIAALNHQIRSRHHQASRDQGAAIAGMEFKALRYIASQTSHQGATQKDLVERSGRDKGQIARVIGNLKKQGLVHAIADEQDKRISRLILTTAGQQLYASFKQVNNEVAEQAISGLTLTECQTLLGLLSKVNNNLATSKNQD